MRKLRALTLTGRRPYARPMKLRHAAALALAGWYLMMPPVYRNGKDVDPDIDIGGTHLDETAPLSKWAIVASFDSAAECEKNLLAGRDLSVIPWEPNLKSHKAIKRLWEFAACIASDDPRLKK